MTMRSGLLVGLFFLGSGLGVGLGCDIKPAATTGGDGGEGGAPTSGTVTGLCSAFCDWRIRCGRGDTTNCTQECIDDVGDVEAKWSGSYKGATTACLQALTCADNEERCLSDMKAADPAYPEIPEVKGCLARLRECGGGGDADLGGTFGDDLCISIAALTPAYRAQADGCRSLGCGEIADCLKNAGSFSF